MLGQVFYMEYGGFGDLWGVPDLLCAYSRKTGDKIRLVPIDGSTRWVNEFVIAGRIQLQVNASTVRLY